MAELVSSRSSFQMLLRRVNPTEADLRTLANSTRSVPPSSCYDVSRTISPSAYLCNLLPSCDLKVPAVRF